MNTAPFKTRRLKDFLLEKTEKVYALRGQMAEYIRKCKRRKCIRLTCIALQLFLLLPLVTRFTQMLGLAYSMIAPPVAYIQMAVCFINIINIGHEKYYKNKAKRSVLYKNNIQRKMKGLAKLILERDVFILFFGFIGSFFGRHVSHYLYALSLLNLIAGTTLA